MGTFKENKHNFSRLNSVLLIISFMEA